MDSSGGRSCSRRTSRRRYRTATLYAVGCRGASASPVTSAPAWRPWSTCSSASRRTGGRLRWQYCCTCERPKGTDGNRKDGEEAGKAVMWVDVHPSHPFIDVVTHHPVGSNLLLCRRH